MHSFWLLRIREVSFEVGLYGRPPPPCTGGCTGAASAGKNGAQKAKNRPKAVVRVYGYRLQELEFRKVDANLLDRNQRRIESLVETGKVKKRDRDYRPAAGTVLVREYKGVEYRVIATADGQYDFQGRMFPSLSMIAREITGMRWSGPLFFGLKPPSNAKTKPTTKKRGGR